MKAKFKVEMSDELTLSIKGNGRPEDQIILLIRSLIVVSKEHGLPFPNLMEAILSVSNTMSYEEKKVDIKELC